MGGTRIAAAAAPGIASGGRSAAEIAGRRPREREGAAKRVLLLAGGLLVLSSASLGAEDAAGSGYRGIGELLEPSTRAELEKSGRIVRSHSSPELGLLPDHPAALAIRDAVASRKPGLVVEAVFMLPRSRPAGEAAREAELASVYGLMRSFGSLKGIEYYSVTYGKMRELYSDSCRIDDPERRTALADEPAPRPGEIPPSEAFFVYQKDTTFGENTYGYSFASYPDAVLVEAVNLTRMRYGPFTMVQPRALEMRLLVVCADEAILFFTESSVDAPALFRSRVGESVANRAEALFRWFEARSGLGAKPSGKESP